MSSLFSGEVGVSGDLRVIQSTRAQTCARPGALLSQKIPKLGLLYQQITLKVQSRQRPKVNSCFRPLQVAEAHSVTQSARQFLVQIQRPKVNFWQCAAFGAKRLHCKATWG